MRKKIIAAIVAVAIPGIVCRLPAAFGGDEVFLDLALKESFGLVHGQTTFRLPVTAS